MGKIMTDENRMSNNIVELKAGFETLGVQLEIKCRGGSSFTLGISRIARTSLRK